MRLEQDSKKNSICSVKSNPWEPGVCVCVCVKISISPMPVPI